ncbi:hypothetical protein ZWY2020_054082 [Hordeum vulgare]|nr:hypothetical protein ZWY2020_054082 [Hordeum vulgare]
MVAEAVGFMMSRAADGGAMAPELVTRDFLGGCQASAPAPADDPRHDAAAMPGKPPLQKHLSPPPSARGDLNLFPVSGAAIAPALAAESAAAATTTTYHSVCTIEKVKTALERFERGKQGQQHHHHHHQQHSGAGAGASPSSSSVTTSSVKRRGDVEQGDGCDSPSASATGGMVAAACPRCFLYVLIARSDPRCPRCESHVPPPPAPAPKKKPRIDLNVGFLGT